MVISISAFALDSPATSEEYPQYEGYTEWLYIDAFGQRNYILAKDPVFLRSMINNFVFALIVVPLQSALALLLAMLINQKIAGVNIFRTIYFSPVVTSMVVISVIWTFLYDKQVGLINQFLTGLTGGLIGPFDWLGNPQSALVAIIIMSIWQGVGFQMVIFLAGLQGIPDSLYEAALSTGQAAGSSSECRLCPAFAIPDLCRHQHHDPGLPAVYPG